MDELTEYLMNNAEDGFWGQIQSEARRETDREPALVSFLFTSVLRHSKLEDALCVILANKLQTPELSAILLRDLCNEALAGDGSICASIRADLLAARTRDPAAHGYLHPLSVLQGFSSSSGIPCRALAVGPGPTDLGCPLPKPHLGGVWRRRASGGSDRRGGLDRPWHKRGHWRDGRR
ncbi:MAG TPA: hypothetical protein VG055_23365 [Planctomycetaceae bacterium]|jgi:hypothetical protein|nr:hypothetical protein [Planctomycetaceae bacterium]